MMKRVKVLNATKIDGRVYRPGEWLTVDETRADALVRAGTAEVPGEDSPSSSSDVVRGSGPRSKAKRR